MKRFFRILIAIVISLAVALYSTALTSTFQPVRQGNLSAAISFFQPTPTPESVDLSQVGSTDGIVVMGFVIVAIVTLPILIRRKAWKESQ